MFSTTTDFTVFLIITFLDTMVRRLAVEASNTGAIVGLVTLIAALAASARLRLIIDEYNFSCDVKRRGNVLL